MIAWFSNCDFWIPGEIWSWSRFFPEKKSFFLETKIFSGKSREKHFQIFSKTKKIPWKTNIQKSKISIFSHFFSIFSIFFYWFLNENFWFSKKSEKIFFRDLPKNILVSRKNIFYQEKIYENRKFAQESKNQT